MHITDDYRKLNEQLHAENSNYGTSGKRVAPIAIKLAAKYKTFNILDYGCGKSTLAKNLPFSIKQYDPAIPKYAVMPEPADIVICSDVLEHIEPEMIDKVLAHLASLTKKAGFFSVATRPAKKTLADGRNAHLIIESINWWTGKIREHFNIANITKEKEDKECFFYVEPKGDVNVAGTINTEKTIQIESAAL
jgi:hypothetical protein